MKTWIVQTCGDYPWYVTPDDEMIASMLYLPPDKNKLLLEHKTSSIMEHIAEYKIDNLTFYDVLDKNCIGTYLYPYVKHHQPKRDGRGAFYVIYSEWLSPNHVNSTESADEVAL